MDYDEVALPELIAQAEDAVAGGIVRGLPARDDGLHLGELVLIDELGHVVCPIGDAYDHHRIHRRIPLEVLHRVDDDRLPADLQELLGA